MISESKRYVFLDNDDIEPLFKAEPPYEEADHGYLGVVLYTTEFQETTR